MPKIILITHQKGGVGKSTLTFNLAQNIAANSRVAVLDFDLQGSLSQLEELVTDFKIIPYQDKLESIVRSTHRVNGIMSAIASASKEQDSGITATNQSVTHMQQISKVNSALVDATTKTARSLQSHADTLRRDMQAFKIDSTKQPSVQTVPTLTVPTKKAVSPSSTSNANSGVFDHRGDTPLQPGAAPNEFEQF